MLYKSPVPMLGRETQSRRPVPFDEDLINRHVHILGGTGSGKSWLMRLLLISLIEANALQRGGGLLLIDPAGDLFDFVRDWVSQSPVLRKRVRLIDLSVPGYFPGLNPLHQPGASNPSNHAAAVIHTINKLFGQADEATRVEVEKLMRLVLVPLIVEDYTLDEIPTLVGNKSFRGGILAKMKRDGVAEDTLIELWQGLERMRESTYYEKAGSVVNRAMPFVNLVTDDRASYIFSQNKNTIDFSEAIEQRQIVLVKLPLTAGYSGPQLDFMGSLILDQAIQAAYLRKPNTGPRFTIFLDEFQHFVSSRDVEVGLNELRKHGISFVLSHQNLSQLEERDPRLYAAVKGNCNVRFFFRMAGEDAEKVAGDFFCNFLAQDQVLHEQYTQLVTPHETTRDVLSRSDVDMYMESVTDMSGGGSSFGTMSGSGYNTGSSLMYSGDNNFSFGGGPIGNSESTMMSDSFSSHSAFSTSWASAKTTGSANGTVLGRAIVPFLEPIISQQLTSVQFRSYQDKMAKAICNLADQNDRYLFMQVGRSIPIPFDTAEVPLPNARRRGVKRLYYFSFDIHGSETAITEIERERAERKKRVRATIDEHDREQLSAPLVSTSKNGKPKKKRLPFVTEAAKEQNGATH